jgi:phosphatidylglycerophosphate synthase
MFWYQTLDAIDGKQARRTDNCSCLGQLLDHNLDQFNYSFLTVMGLAMIKGSGDPNVCSMIALGNLLPHYTIEHRKHFTEFHATVTDTAGGIQIGATEQLLIMYSL